MTLFFRYIIVFFLLIFLFHLYPERLLAWPGEELKLDPGDYFSSGQIEKAKDYRVPKYWMWAGKNLLLIIFLLIFVFTPPGEALKNFCYRVAGIRKWPAPGLYSAILMTLWLIISFPVHFYSAFLYEHKFSLSNQPFSDWFKQYLLSSFIDILVFTIVVSAFYGIVKLFPRYWVLVSGGSFGIFLFLSVYLMPVLILPLFNKFEPLPGGLLRDMTLETGRKGGIENIEEIYVMDASRQTKKGNAYFLGIGNTTRIVLYDTLKDSYPVDETMAVIAHEAGNWKHNHIIKGILLALAASFLFLSLIFILLTFCGKMFHISSPEDIRGLPLILLVFVLVNIFSLPVQNRISRHFERQADLAALELTDAPQACIKLDQRLAIQNFSEITPSASIVWLLYTHPPVMERIAMAEWYRKNKK